MYFYNINLNIYKLGFRVFLKEDNKFQRYVVLWYECNQNCIVLYCIPILLEERYCRMDSTSQELRPLCLRMRTREGCG